MTSILDGAEIARSANGLSATDPRSVLLAFYPGASIPPLDHVVMTAEPLVARVNHGVWIASCSCGARGLPAPGCAVWLDVPLGWCVRCGNRGWGGGWRPIVVPTPEMRARIEAVLLCRPHPEDRNWEPHESIADLIAQNVERGDPVPPAGDDEPPAPAAPRIAPFPPFARMAAVLGRLAGRRK